MKFNEFIKDGLNGKNRGLMTGIKAFDESFFGIIKGKMYIIAGDSGCGKTTLVDSRVLLNHWDDPNVNFIYFSFELSEIQKRIKWLNYFIFKYEGIIIPENILCGYDGVMNQDQIDLVAKYTPIVDKIFDKILFFTEENSNPTGIRMELFKYAEKHGKFIKSSYKDDKQMTQFRIDSYEETNPHLRTVIIIDHIGLGSPEIGANSEKEIIDKITKVLVWFRNICGFTSIVIQQFSSSLQNANRDPRAQDFYTPQQTDLGGSTYTYRYADTVIGGVNPGLYNVPSFMGYKIIGGYGSSASFWFVMKNRDFGNRPVAKLFRKEAPILMELPAIKK